MYTLNTRAWVHKAQKIKNKGRKGGKKKYQYVVTPKTTLIISFVVPVY